MTTATKVEKKPAKASTKKAKGPSRRAQQRLIALKMGLEKKGLIPAEDLREACRKAGLAKNGKAWGANFSQDMKKDAILFNPVEKNGKRVGWKLTDAGRKAAKLAAKAAN